MVARYSIEYGYLRFFFDVHRWSASRRRRRRGFVRGAGTPAHARRGWGSGRRNYRGTSAQRCGEAGERCRHGRQVSLAGLVSSALSSARCAYFQAVAALGGDGLSIATHRQWRRLENTNADVCAGLSRRSLRFCLCSCVSWARGCAAVAAPVAARCSPTRVCELSARGCVSTRCIILTEPSFALGVLSFAAWLHFPCRGAGAIPRRWPRRYAAVCGSSTPPRSTRTRSMWRRALRARALRARRWCW